MTSAAPEEGKTTVTANLSHALSVTGRHVLAVSADLHNPTLHEYFPATAETRDTMAVPALSDSMPASQAPPRSSHRSSPVGLIQVLAGDVDLRAAVRPVQLSPAEQATGGSLDVLADSRTFFDPSVLLGSSSMQRFLSEASRDYDVVVLDTPPMLANADAMLLAHEADILVVVARLDHLTRNQARRAVQVMNSTRVVATGIIVTGELDEPTYGYGYRFEYEEHERSK